MIAPPTAENFLNEIAEALFHESQKMSVKLAWGQLNAKAKGRYRRQAQAVIRALIGCVSPDGDFDKKSLQNILEIEP